MKIFSSNNFSRQSKQYYLYSFNFCIQPKITSSSAKATTLSITNDDPEMEIAFGISPIRAA